MATVCCVCVVGVVLSAAPTLQSMHGLDKISFSPMRSWLYGYETALWMSILVFVYLFVSISNRT